MEVDTKQPKQKKASLNTKTTIRPKSDVVQDKADKLIERKEKKTQSQQNNTTNLHTAKSTIE